MRTIAHEKDVYALEDDDLSFYSETEPAYPNAKVTFRVPCGTRHVLHDVVVTRAGRRVHVEVSDKRCQAKPSRCSRLAVVLAGRAMWDDVDSMLAQISTAHQDGCGHTECEDQWDWQCELGTAPYLPPFAHAAVWAGYGSIGRAQMWAYDGAQAETVRAAHEAYCDGVTYPHEDGEDYCAHAFMNDLEMCDTLSVGRPYVTFCPITIEDEAVREDVEPAGPPESLFY